MEQARIFGVQKTVAVGRVGTVCAYPTFTQVSFKAGDPEENDASYGLAKKMSLVHSQAYPAQHGFSSTFVHVVNVYGRGITSMPRSSHVIPALIKISGATERGDERIVVWGTGKATREFLYVEDGAKGVLLPAERYDKGDPVDPGASFEISISDLVDLIVEHGGFKGKSLWDTTNPVGQPRRCLDTSRAERQFGFKARVGLHEDPKRARTWYPE